VDYPWSFYTRAAIAADFTILFLSIPAYRRTFIEGGWDSFTVVTFNQQPILTNDECRAMLHAAWVDVSGRFPFRTTG
jgi:hypothetical protein